LAIAFFFLACNLCGDILHLAIDPQLRIDRGSWK
jgi:hypothetical protein